MYALCNVYALILYCNLRYLSILQIAVGYNNFKGGEFMFKRIRELREDNDLTQTQVAKELNCSQQVYSNYEHGQRDIPTDILIKRSKFYKVSTDYILELTNNPNIQK